MEATDLQDLGVVEKDRRRVRVGGLGHGIVVDGTVEAASRSLLSERGTSGCGALHLYNTAPEMVE